RMSSRLPCISSAYKGRGETARTSCRLLSRLTSSPPACGTRCAHRPQALPLTLRPSRYSHLSLPCRSLPSKISLALTPQQHPRKLLCRLGVQMLVTRSVDPPAP